MTGDPVKKSVARGIAALGGAAALAALVGTAPAGAINEYEGQTYADAANAIRQGAAP